jgi:hypothetical protein
LTYPGRHRHVHPKWRGVDSIAARYCTSERRDEHRADSQMH